MSTARLMWTLYEPVHAVTYFSPEARAAFEAAGLHGFWRGYFGSRVAPLGPVGPAPVLATLFNFAPRMVERAVPEIWDRATPEQALRVRVAGASAALARLTADQPAGAVSEAADLLATAAGNVEYGGRVLGAANAALPMPDEPLGRLWQAATVLREHRGDGHVAAIVAAGLTGLEMLVWRGAYDLDRAVIQPARSWTDEEWAAAAARLADLGWLDAEGQPTGTGKAAYADVEAATDRAAAHPWDGVDVDRLRTVLTPIARACHAAMPPIDPIGLPAPGAEKA